MVCEWARLPLMSSRKCFCGGRAAFVLQTRHERFASQDPKSTTTMLATVQEPRCTKHSPDRLLEMS